MFERAYGYFEFLGDMGLTKHIGSMEATRRLLELCHIGGGDLVLDVGCGVGATPIFPGETPPEEAVLYVRGKDRDGRSRPLSL
jgi:hypothetical protein